MRADDFLARLGSLGIKYECMYARVNGEEVALRYLSLDGKCSPIDLGDLSRVTETVMKRIAADLGISMEALTGLLH